MNEINGEFRIVGYVDSIEESMDNAESENMSQELIGDMNAVHGDVVELGSLLSTQEHYDSLTDAVEDLIDDLVDATSDGDAAKSSEVLSKLRENVAGLKKQVTSS